MRLPVAIVDTNVVVSGLLTRDPEAPTARLLSGMLSGAFPFLLSQDLLAEYRNVLLRPKVQRLHGLSESEVDAVLVEIAANGILREPASAFEPAPEPGDDHLWALMGAHGEAVLVTGDQLLLSGPPTTSGVLSPRSFSRPSLLLTFPHGVAIVRQALTHGRNWLEAASVYRYPLLVQSPPQQNPASDEPMLLRPDPEIDRGVALQPVAPLDSAS